MVGSEIGGQVIIRPVSAPEWSDSMKWLATFLGLVLLTACTTTLTQTGAQVRVVDETNSSGCQFIATVSADSEWGANATAESENALNALRNKAAGLGANAIKIMHMGFDSGVMVASAQALRCPTPN